jgi:hypothetical protein
VAPQCVWPVYPVLHNLTRQLHPNHSGFPKLNAPRSTLDAMTHPEPTSITEHFLISDILVRQTFGPPQTGLILQRSQSQHVRLRVPSKDTAMPVRFPGREKGSERPH